MKLNDLFEDVIKTKKDGILFFQAGAKAKHKEEPFDKASKLGFKDGRKVDGTDPDVVKKDQKIFYGMAGEKQAFEYAKQRMQDGETVAVIQSFTPYADGSAQDFFRVFSKK